MANYNQTDPFAFYTGTLNESHNGADYDENEGWPLSSYYIFPVFITLICILGILGNGAVIWLLGFNLKMNHFTRQILNLALTDFILLIAVIICIISVYLQLFMDSLSVFLFFSMFTASQVLRALITMDRCVSLLFPLSHCRYWPKKFYILVCALTWVVSFLSPAINFTVSMGSISNSYIILYQYIGTTLLCFTLMAISSLMLFIKLCGKSKNQRRQKIVITISVMAFFFFLLCLPVNIFSMIYLFPVWDVIMVPSAMLCACFNSSINPFIYYLVGKPKDGRSSKSMKAALRILIKEEEVHLLENPAGTPL